MKLTIDLNEIREKYQIFGFNLYIVGRIYYWRTFCCNPIVNQTTFGKLTKYQRYWTDCMQFLQLYLVCIWIHIFVVVLDNIFVSIAMFVNDRVMDIDYSLIIQFIHDKYRLRRCCFLWIVATRDVSGRSLLLFEHQFIEI